MPPCPPFTVEGWNVTELSAGGGAACTVNGALTTTSSSAAKNVTVRVVGSPRVKAVNVPDVAPPAIAPNCEPVSAANGSLLQTLTSSSGPAGHFDEVIGAVDGQRAGDVLAAGHGAMARSSSTTASAATDARAR